MRPRSGPALREVIRATPRADGTGHTLASFARVVGCTRGMISMLVTERSGASDDLAMRIARFTDRKVSDLFHDPWTSGNP